MSKKHPAARDDEPDFEPTLDLSEAPAVPADRAGGGAGEKVASPPFGTAKPAGEGDVPRVVKELARVEAGSGLTRFKISCSNYTPQPRKYILARDEASARECYLKVTKLGETMEKLRKNGHKDLEPADLVVTVLPD